MDKNFKADGVIGMTAPYIEAWLPQINEKLVEAFKLSDMFEISSPEENKMDIDFIVMDLYVPKIDERRS